MNKPVLRRASDVLRKRLLKAYRPVELSREIKAATSGIQVIYGNDSKRAQAILEERRTE
jgi:hypothetical protein